MAARHAEGPPEHLWGERRAAHPADERPREAVAAGLGREGLELGDARFHALDEREPAEAVGDLRLVLRVVRLPQRRVLLPEPRAHARLVHGARRRLHARGRASERNVAAPPHQHGLAPRRDGGDERVVRLGEGRDALDLEPFRHGFHADAHLREALEHPFRLVDVALEADLRTAVVAVRVERGRRHRVDGVRSDERLDVVGVGVRRVLGRRARPERPLDPGARARERGEALGAELPAERGVGELGVGDRRLAAERLEQRGGLAGAAPALLVEQAVDGRVDPAHEEARDGRDPVDALARCEPPVESVQVRVHDGVVAGEGEDECDVDVQPIGDRLLDGGHAGARRRDLDHQVRTIDRAPEPVRLAHRPLRVVREPRGDLEADEAVATRRSLEHRQEQVGRVTDVTDGDRLVDLLRGLSLGGERVQLGVVVAARRDRLLEDRGIRGEPRHLARGDQAREPPRGKEGSVDVVVPGRLSELVELDERIDRRDGRRLLPRHLAPPHPRHSLTGPAGGGRARRRARP